MRRAIFDKQTGDIIKIVTADSNSIQEHLRPGWDVSINEPPTDDNYCMVDINTKQCRKMTNLEYAEHMKHQKKVHDKVKQKDLENSQELWEKVNQYIEKGDVNKLIYKLIKDESLDDEL